MTAAAFDVSFEFFPPGTPEGSARLWRSVERLAPLAPRFVSVTYGAGGATRDRTRAAIAAIRERAGLEVAGHLTCVGATKAETLEVAESYRALGARRVVALRGDPPKGQGRFAPHPDGFESSVELVAALAAAGHGRISVGCYPETHPEAASPEADLDHLKRKLDAGADSAVSQFFFDNADFLRFRDRAVAAGVTAPIIPGVLPIENFAKMRRFAEACGAGVPEALAALYDGADDRGETFEVTRRFCADQCRALLAEGVRHLHFYTLNNPDLTYDICRSLGIEPRAAGAA